MYEGDWLKMYKVDNFVNEHLRKSLPHKISIRGERRLENIKIWSLFRYVQSDIELTGNLREAFAKFPPIFKNINCGRDDICPFMLRHQDLWLELGEC